jgi:hypothetical protein
MCRTRANRLHFSTINREEGGNKNADRGTVRPKTLFSFAVFLCCGLKNIGRTVIPKGVFTFECVERVDNGLKFTTIDSGEGGKENIEFRTRIS